MESVLSECLLLARALLVLWLLLLLSSVVTLPVASLPLECWILRGLMLRDARLGLLLVWSGLVLTHPLPYCLVFFCGGIVSGFGAGVVAIAVGRRWTM